MKRKKVVPIFLNLIVIVLFSLGLESCLDFNDLDDIKVVNSNAEYAIPLINSKLTIENAVLEAQDINNATVEYDENEVVIIKYGADVVRKQSNEIFIPIVFPGPLPFTDSVTLIAFDQIDNYNVKKGKIRGDSIRFGFTSPFNEDIAVTIKIKEATLNGVQFAKQITIPALSTVITPMYPLKGYEFISPENALSFSYDARLSNGDRVLLDGGYFEFTYFIFDYVEGFLGKNTQKLYDHQIQVNLFDLWESGLLEFYDPKIKVKLENSFGFPVKAQINHFEVTDINDVTKSLESTIFDNDVFFNYPALDEIGEVKSTEFIFDKDNSNFASAFNQKIKEVSYDVDAIANPDNDPSSIGFFVFDSYYLLNVSVEIPMIFKADQFKMAGNIEIDSFPVDLGLVEEFELKTFIDNHFPIDAYVQLYFMDENENVLDSLFEEGQKHFPAAIQQQDGSFLAVDTDPFFVLYDQYKKDIFKQSKKLVPIITLNTKNNDEEWISLSKDQGIDIKMGVKIKMK